LRETTPAARAGRDQRAKRDGFIVGQDQHYAKNSAPLAARLGLVTPYRPPAPHAASRVDSNPTNR